MQQHHDNNDDDNVKDDDDNHNDDEDDNDNDDDKCNSPYKMSYAIENLLFAYARQRITASVHHIKRLLFF